MAGAGLTGFLQNLSGGEMIVILIVALVVLGPERLPDLAKGAGRMVHKLKTMTDGLSSEMRDVMDDPSMQPLKELGELAARPRQKLTEYALEAEAEERSKREAAAHAAHEAAVTAADAATGGAPAETASDDAVTADDPADPADPSDPSDPADPADPAGDEGAPAVEAAPERPDPTRLGPLVAAVEKETARARATGNRTDGQDPT